MTQPTPPAVLPRVTLPAVEVDNLYANLDHFRAERDRLIEELELLRPVRAERDKLVETIGRLVGLPPHLVAEAYGVTYTGSVKP